MDYAKTPGGILMPAAALTVGGVFECELFRKGRLIDAWETPNLVVNEGLNHVLDAVFHAATQITAWYIGLFEGNYTPLASLTAATFDSAATECTAYDDSTRPAYTEAAASSQSITNSANRASFVFNATKTIYGAALISDSTKEGTSGTLMAAARFSSSKSVVDDDELLVTYTFTASSV